MYTLDNYLVNYDHVKIQQPSIETEHNLLKLMCVEAAKVLYRQCSREYGFVEDELGELKPRATKKITSG